MTASFPTSLPPVYSSNSTDTAGGVNHRTSLHVNDRDDIRALGTKLGLGSSTPSAPGVLRCASGTATAWGTLSHDYLDNRTRYLWVPATAMEAIIGSPTLSTYSSILKYWSFAAANDEAVAGSVIMPEGFIAATDVAAHAYWFGGTGGEGGNNARVQVGAKSLADGETLDLDFAAAVSFAGPSANVLKITSLATNISSSVSPGEWTGIAFRRLGNDGADTYTGIIGLLGVRLTVTLDM